VYGVTVIAGVRVFYIPQLCEFLMHAIEYLLAINSHYYCLLPILNSKLRHESVIFTVYCLF
jgi:hypothetical protein